jgi:tRNA A-37 threonylcarbamoyl transferase component Bud32
VNWDSAQSPDRAWRHAGELQRIEDATDLANAREAILLQDEARIRIVLSTSSEGERQVSKIYRTPLALTWRDLFRYPQAQREHENLQFAFERGLPVAKSLGFGLSRRFGSDWYSQLTTVFLEGETLRDVLARTTADREKLIYQAGQLVAAMHQAGMVWGTAHTGNFMVHGDAGRSMTAFDLPYAYCAGKNMVGGRLALYDIWNMTVDMRTQCGLDEPVVRRFFDAYASEADVNADSLQAEVDARKGRNSVFPERLFIRTVRSFRLKPF